MFHHHCIEDWFSKTLKAEPAEDDLVRINLVCVTRTRTEKIIIFVFSLDTDQDQQSATKVRHV
jgi:hypothetical protein